MQALWPRRAAASGLRTVAQMGGAGRCSGRGAMSRLSNDQYRPRCDKCGLCSDCSMMSRASWYIGRISSSPMPTATASRGLEPRATPISSRPWLSWSRTPISSSRRHGRHIGNTQPRRPMCRRRVRAATMAASSPVAGQARTPLKWCSLKKMPWKPCDSACVHISLRQAYSSLQTEASKCSGFSSEEMFSCSKIHDLIMPAFPKERGTAGEDRTHDHSLPRGEPRVFEGPRRQRTGERGAFSMSHHFARGAAQAGRDKSHLACAGGFVSLLCRRCIRRRPVRRCARRGVSARRCGQTRLSSERTRCRAEVAWDRREQLPLHAAIERSRSRLQGTSSLQHLRCGITGRRAPDAACSGAPARAQWRNSARIAGRHSW